MADRLGMSWAYWSYDPNGPEGWGPWNRETGAENPNASLLVRPYPRRVPGRDLRFSFDRGTGALEVAYRPEPGVGGPLEITLPERIFGGAGAFEVLEGEGPDEAEWDAGRQVLSLHGLRGTEKIRLRVTPSEGLAPTPQ